MKQLLQTLLMCVLASLVFTYPTVAQQTPINTNCNDESKLSWQMNVETDMDHYNVYSSNFPLDPTIDNSSLILVQVPHPAPGVTEVLHPLKSTLSDGDKYFRISAIDKAGNESPLSKEVGCKYDKIPATPVNIQIILKQQAP
jgi:hypothetical protein